MPNNLLCSLKWQTKHKSYRMNSSLVLQYRVYSIGWKFAFTSFPVFVGFNFCQDRITGRSPTANCGDHMFYTSKTFADADADFLAELDSTFITYSQSVNWQKWYVRVRCMFTLSRCVSVRLIQCRPEGSSDEKKNQQQIGKWKTDKPSWFVIQFTAVISLPLFSPLHALISPCIIPAVDVTVLQNTLWTNLSWHHLWSMPTHSGAHSTSTVNPYFFMCVAVAEISLLFNLLLNTMVAPFIISLFLVYMLSCGGFPGFYPHINYLISVAACVHIQMCVPYVCVIAKGMIG